MPNEDFYATLSAVPLDEGLCDIAKHEPVPDDWYIAVADIAGSTKAISEGRYKDVNIASACAITAVINAVDKTKIGYIFGGDGATFLIPPSFKLKVAAALYGTANMVRDCFDLEMRVGLVNVGTSRKAGGDIRIAKVATTDLMSQTSLSGAGVSLAEQWIKCPQNGTHYAATTHFDVASLAQYPPSFEGFECRWEPVKSRNGIDVSLIVTGRTGDVTRDSALFRDILNHLPTICGAKENWKPVSTSQLTISNNNRQLDGERKVKTYGRKDAKRFLYGFFLQAITTFGRAATGLGFKMGGFDGRTYKDEVVAHSDFIKFDNALRITMDITPESKERLSAYLEDMRGQKKYFTDFTPRRPL